MQIFEKIKELKNCLNSARNHSTIGLVPTMGALHEGHLSLINLARKENEFVVCSIFVNPAQFNDPGDLINYPRTLESDIEKLQSVNCNILFVPSVDEIYADNENESVPELGNMATTMEGEFRPGHFKGVALIVNKLFNIIEPDVAYFGEKDFQQLAIIKELVDKTSSPIRIAGCEIIREPDGLAMSSRNILLTPSERKEAPLIYRTLSEAKRLKSTSSIDTLKEWVIKTIELSPLMKVDYFEIVDENSLLPVSNWKDSKNVRGCIAVKIGKIRLLDNIALFS